MHDVLPLNPRAFADSALRRIDGTSILPEKLLARFGGASFGVRFYLGSAA
jgi:hypothetical protein